MIGMQAAESRPARVFLDRWMDGQRLALVLQRRLPVMLGLLLVVLAIPPVLGYTDLSYLWCALVVTFLIVPFSLGEPADTRRLFLAVWALGFLLRVVLLLAVFDASVRAGGPFLGPDSSEFFRESRVIADRGFVLGAHPIAVFETYDVAHYYVYAFLMRAFNADLFALQLFNCGLTALAAPLMLSLARRVIPRWAVFFAVLVAINPSLMVLSIKDLLKDPSILGALSMTLWGLVRLCEAPRWPSRIAYGSVAALALSYLHMDRFYVAAYLEIAAVALLAFLAWRGKGGIQRHVVAAVLAVFVVSEALPMALGWPSAPAILVEQVRFVGRSAGMFQADMGVTERAVRSRQALRKAAEGAKDESISTLEPVSLTIQSAGVGINLVRRFFGPFVWIAPEAWTVRHLLSGDYLLYPGTLVWYFVLPLALTGGILTIRRIANGEEQNPAIIGLMVFCGLYFAQYLLINLSFRQRDVMFPVVAMFAFMGAPLVVAPGRWRTAFISYWVMLGVMASGHLVVRYYFA